MVLRVHCRLSLPRDARQRHSTSGDMSTPVTSSSFTPASLRKVTKAPVPHPASTTRTAPSSLGRHASAMRLNDGNCCTCTRKAFNDVRRDTDKLKKTGRRQSETTPSEPQVTVGEGGSKVESLWVDIDREHRRNSNVHGRRFREVVSAIVGVVLVLQERR